MRQNKKNYGSKFILLVFCLVFLIVGFVVGYQYARRSQDAGQVELLNNGSEVKITGIIKSDDCRQVDKSIGDTGCSITVKGYKIQIVHGFINTPKLGGISGLDTSTNQSGKIVQVYAKVVDANNASIWEDSKYFVHIY